MAQSGSTPIILFHSTTPGNTPTTANLNVGELALNIPDGKLFFTDGSTVYNFNANNTGTVTSVAASGGTTGLTFSGSPITTSGTLTLSGTLNVANGGTGVTTATGTGGGASVVLSQSPAINSPVLTAYSTSTVPLKVYGLNGQLTELFDVYTYSGGTLAFQINSSGAISTGTWNGSVINPSYGGTGVSTLTGLAYGNGTSAFTAATAAQVVGVIGATAVTNATNAANVTLAAASSATNYVVMGGSATGNVTELTDTNFTFNATTHVITGGIAGGGF